MEIFEIKVGKKTEKLTPGRDNRKFFYGKNLKLYNAFAHVKTDGILGIGEKKPNGSVKIGNIGGPGGVSGTGSNSSYVHTHIAFYSEYLGNPTTGTRVDP